MEEFVNFLEKPEIDFSRKDMVSFSTPSLLDVICSFSKLRGHSNSGMDVDNGFKNIFQNAKAEDMNICIKRAGGGV